jgi:hypothetical protein
MHTMNNNFLNNSNSTGFSDVLAEAHYICRFSFWQISDDELSSLWHVLSFFPRLPT